MSRLVVAADHSCEFSQGNALSLTPTVAEKKKKRAAEFLQFSFRLSGSPTLAGANELTGRTQCRRVSRWLIGSSVALYIYGERGRTRSGNRYEDRGAVYVFGPGRE